MNIFNIKKDLSKNNDKKENPLIIEKFKSFNLKKSFYLKDRLNNENKNNNSNLDIIQIRVILSLSYHKDTLEFFLPSSIKIEEETNKTQFNLTDIIESLILKYGKDFFSDYIISYYIKDNKNQYDDNYCGNDNNKIGNKISFISTETKSNNKNKKKKSNIYIEINLEDFNNKKPYYIKLPKDLTLYINLRQKIEQFELVDFNILEENNNNYMILNSIYLEEKKNDKNEKNEKKVKNNNINITSRRDKEKTIGYAIKKVFEWLIIREKNEISAIEASKLIGMKKKTLEGYHNEIIKGKEKGFNFLKYMKNGMNFLRKFNKRMRKKNVS